MNPVVEAAVISGGCSLAGAVVSALASVGVAHMSRTSPAGQALPQTIFGLQAAQWMRMAKFFGAVVIGAVIVLVIALLLDQGNSGTTTNPPLTPVTTGGGPVTPASDSPPDSTPGSLSSCATGLRLTSPSNNSSVPDGSKGITITGSMCGLPASDSGWLVESVPADPTSGYVIDDTASEPKPVATQPGSWSYRDDSIGDSGTKEVVRISLVHANPLCAEKLGKVKPDSNQTYWVPTLPAECAVTDHRDLTVTNP